MKSTSLRQQQMELPGAGHLRLLLLILLLTSCFASPIHAQQTDDEQKGIDQGNYNIKQSIEFGYRFTDITGNMQTYNTMVDLQQGPRLLNFTTEMRSLDNRGTFFDRFYFSNFGYGGDPNVVTVLRVSKNKWYSFDGLFRHDENFWDYSPLANPQNPATPVANAPANFNPIAGAPVNVLGTPVIATSPHYYNTRRNIQTYGVTFLPDSKVRFRFGYNLNTNQGPAFSTIHQGTEQYLLESISTSLQQYRVGVDFRFLPRTNISYDEIWSFYKTDPGLTDENRQFSVGSGFPLVDLGVSWNGPPCNPAFQTTGLVNPACNAYSSYYSHWQSRLHAPTEQVRLESSFFPSVQFSGKYVYTGSDLNVYNYNQSFVGLESRSMLSNFAETGPMQGRHVTSYADFGVTWKLTPMLSIVDEFHYGNWLEPAQFLSTQCSFFSGSLIVAPNLFPHTAPFPATCAAPSGVPGTPTHSSTNSGPDILINLDSNFLKQQITTNLIEAQFQIAPKAGAYFGYRYEHRVIADDFYNTQDAIYYPNNAMRGNCALSGGILPLGCTLNPDGSVTYQTPSPSYSPPSPSDFDYNSAVLGLWVKPSPKLTLNVDAEITSANNTFTTLAPQNAQQVRIKAHYKPSNWLDFTAYFLTSDGQNPTDGIDGSQHNSNAGIFASVTPSEKYSFQFGYNYNSIFSQIYVCFTSSLALPGLLVCPGNTSLVQQLSTYTSNINNGFLDIQWTPLPRLTLTLGGNISSATGSELNLNPQSATATTPTAALNSAWYTPYGGVAYRFAKGWTGRAFWQYYGYHEDANGSYLDLYAPRNFRGNTVTLSVRYAF